MQLGSRHDRQRKTAASTRHRSPTANDTHLASSARRPHTGLAVAAPQTAEKMASQKRLVAIGRLTVPRRIAAQIIVASCIIAQQKHGSRRSGMFGNTVAAMWSALLLLATGSDSRKVLALDTLRRASGHAAAQGLLNPQSGAPVCQRCSLRGETRGPPLRRDRDQGDGGVRVTRGTAA